MRRSQTFTVALLTVMAVAWVNSYAGAAESKSYRFDCGAADSPVMRGYRRLTPEDSYSAQKGFGWETRAVSATDDAVFPELAKYLAGRGSGALLYEHVADSVNAINRDFVSSADDLLFRADLPDGEYRVTLVIGDISQPLGSIDVSMNGTVVSKHVAAWSPGTTGSGNHRRIMQDPWGWWNTVRRTVEVSDGVLKIKLARNQDYYDRMIAKQAIEEPAWEKAVEQPFDKAPPYKRVGVTSPPYYFCGWPFVHNSLMAIEIVPHNGAPVSGSIDKLTVVSDESSSPLRRAITKFNSGSFDNAVRALDAVTAKEDLPAKAAVALWLAGRLETEFDVDQRLVDEAVEILNNYVPNHPDENQMAELLVDAKSFQKAWRIHMARGEAPIGENHFVENLKAMIWWWAIDETSPLFYQAQLHIARAEHMLIPYFPSRGTFREIFKNLEKRFPDNRFVKYHLHEEWAPHGDGSKYHDWYMADYDGQVKDSPEWVKQLYPAFRQSVDWCEWWIRYRQEASGTIGGGWGDDVEIVGAFGYYGLTSRDTSDILIGGTAKLIDGLWYNSEIDPELGFSVYFTDAEHVSEYTGNTLGMMTALDYGNPQWIERSMKTGKLARDLWTDFDVNGNRRFRANYFSAAQVGGGSQSDDTWIDYRTIRPLHAVFRYNSNPGAAKLLVELADAWLYSCMSTERGKPAGVIPAFVSFPEAVNGGHNSPEWYRHYRGPDRPLGTWGNAGYKPYIVHLFISAYQATNDAKYLEPMRLEYELAARYDNVRKVETGIRLQSPPIPLEFGKRLYEFTEEAKKRKQTKEKTQAKGYEPGSEGWVGKTLKDTEKWIDIRRMLEGRTGALKNDLTKEDIIAAGYHVRSDWRWRWPMHTTEAGPTDRVGFKGFLNPFLIYTGGRRGGPILESAVTYENTTREFAAAVMGNDAQGLRILYHSLADDTREIGIVPWMLEPGGKYLLRYGPDADENEIMDSLTEEREVEFPQLGTAITANVKPRVTYLIEIDQTVRGRGPSLAPDPALSPDDIRLYRGRLLARIHNVGSVPVRNVEVAAYAGDPQNGGELIGKSVIPNIEAPIDLDPKTTTIGFHWSPKKKTDVYVVVDPEDKIKDDITTFNNVAHVVLPRGVPKEFDEAGKKFTN